jgi:glutamine amidotransferase
MGNIGSLSNAIYSQGWDPILISSPVDLDDISHLIIPGVGAYDSAMNLLSEKKLITFVHDFAESGKPLLGICLGMQILSSVGSENTKSNGLGLIPGEVKLMKSSENLKLPHVGWNNISLSQDHILLEGIKKNVDFYFVHSYCFHAHNKSQSIASTEYGNIFTSIVANGNVFGTQFHPEKSQKNGLKILDNFCLWDGKC